MGRTSKLLSMVLIVFGMISCEKEEIPVRYVPSQLEAGTFSTQLNMSSDYRYRLYYDIESDSVVAFHEKTDWDLAFACGMEDDRIRLNDSKLMSLWKVEGMAIEDINSVQGDGPLYDTSDGLLRATDGWVATDAVYIIDRGYDEVGIPQGRYKVEFLSVDEQSYLMRYAPLTSQGISEAIVIKDPTVNQVHFSFDEGPLTLEPPRETWDLLFTHYTFYFEEEELPYLVAGVLINPNAVIAQSLDLYDFDSIDADYISGITLIDRRDVIGYDWKYFDLDTETYSVVDNAYAIQTVEGNVFKLQFTSFVDASGERGSPAFRAAMIQ